MKKNYELINKYLRTSLNICDVGAAGGISDKWNKINKLFVVGFEPDDREYYNLIETDNQKWFNIGLHSCKGKFPLYITGYQTNTSLYKPNMVLTNNLSYKNNDFVIEREVEVDCDTLDNILNSNNLKLDYIKLDTQGSELDILKGASGSLDDEIFAVETEVEFIDLYQNQPLFADVDIFLRDKGFVLMDIGNMLHVKGKQTVGIGGQKSFLLSADALYFKSIDQTIAIIKNLGEDKLFKIIAICMVYGYNDYALEICYRLENQNIISPDKLVLLINDLKKVRNNSDYIPEFRYKSYVRKLFILLAELFNKTKNASWINDLGN